MELRILTILSGSGMPFNKAVGTDTESAFAETGRSSSEFIRHLRTEDLRAICKDLTAQAVELKKENRLLKEENGLLKEELNELYLKYDSIAAAFGEINHFIQEAAAVPARHFGEVQA